MIVDDYGNLVSPAAVRSIWESLEEGDARMERIEVDVGGLRLDLDGVRRDLKANTEATQELSKNTADLVEFIQALKGMFKVLDWLGRVAKPLALIFGLGTAALGLYAAWKGHKLK